MTNLLNQKLKAIQSSRAYLEKKVRLEPDPDERVKISRAIIKLNHEEKEILKELNDL